MDPSWNSTPSCKQLFPFPIRNSHLAVRVTPQESLSTRVFLHVATICFLVVIAFYISSLRRKLFRVAPQASLALPVSASPLSRPRSPPPPPPGSHKGGYYQLIGNVEEEHNGASSSSMHAPPQYSPAPEGSTGEGQHLQRPGRQYPAPPEFGLAPGIEVDDDLIERVAQRVARIVQAQPPPDYEGATSTEH